MEIEIFEKILRINDSIAHDNRLELNNRKTLGINIIGSPGAGKTSLIIKTIQNINMLCSVIEGDIASDLDSKKVAELNVPTIQINTDGTCHLDANMICRALLEINTESRILFIENIGNLVCPSNFDLGEDFKVAICSVSEGDDKPYKYPAIFTKARAVILNKIDLIPYINFNKEFFYSGLKALNPTVKVFEVSAKTGDGIADWSMWVEKQFQGKIENL